MKINTKVSVCIPVYNRDSYIGEAIESVLNQTFTDWELIITDNCSTDKTPEIINEYANKDSRIKYLKNDKNLGVCSNGNLAILHARGEYIKFLFSDDKLSPKCLEIFVNKMDSHPNVSLITSYTQSFGEVEHVRDREYFPGLEELDGLTYQKDLLINGNWAGSPSSVMYRRNDLHIGLGHHLWRYWVGDLDLWIRLLGIGNAYVVPEILSYLRIHKQQESSLQAVDFRLIKERMLLSEISFKFPHIYGNYTKKERQSIRNHLLKRLVREGIGKQGLQSKIEMIKIGFSDLSPNKLLFFTVLIKNLRRLFKKNRFSSDPV